MEKLKIKSVKVDWMDGWDNNPTFEIELNRDPVGSEYYPRETDPVWQNFDGIHIAHRSDSPLVWYFYTNGKPCNGFGGRTISGTFTNGDYFSYHGAWSSRAGVVNSINRVDPRTGDVMVPTIIDVVWKHGAMGVKFVDVYYWWLNNWLDLDWGLVLVEEPNGEKTILPHRGGKLKNDPPKGSKVTLLN